MNSFDNTLQLDNYISHHNDHTNFLNLDRCLRQPYTIENVSNTETITGISLAYNYLLQIPTFISDYTNLIELNANHNHLYTSEFLLYRSLDIHEQPFNEKSSQISRPLIHPFLQRINLSFNHIKTLPLNLHYLRFLHTLNLSYNYLEELPDNLGYLEQLHTLILNNNSIQILPNTFTRLSKLEYLNLSSNQFQSIDIIKNFVYLKSISFDSNPLKTFPLLLNTCANLEDISISNINLNQLNEINFEYFSQFNRLKKLNLSNNYLTDNFFRTNNQNFDVLEELYLQNNKLKTIFSLLSTMKSLYLIDLTSNLLTRIPENFNSQLKILRLGNNSIEIKPQNCVYLKNLIELDLENNQLKQIPNEFLQCLDLQILNLSKNKFEKLPEIIFQLRSLNKLILNLSSVKSLINENLFKKFFSRTLNSLDLSKNCLSTNLNELTCLKNLIYLDLSSNQLNELHENFRLLTCLKILKLSKNKFMNFPSWLYQMSREANQKFIASTLLELYIDNNKIKSIPEEIVHMTSLETIDLSNNQFPIFPEALIYLEQLTTLIYSQQYGIHISKLPDDFIHLYNLKHLDLSHNIFYEIPQLIYNLAKLEYLNMNSNLLTALEINRLKELTDLNELNLHGNYFSSFPSIIYQYDKFSIDNNSLCISPPNDYIKTEDILPISNYYVQINDQYEEKLFDIYKQVFIEYLTNSDLERFLIRLKLSENDINNFRKNAVNLKREEKIELLFNLWKEKRNSLANTDTLFKLTELIADKKLSQQMKKAYLLARTVRI